MPALSGTGTSGDEPGTRGPSDVSVGERTLPAKETSDAFLLEELRALGRADGVAALSRLSGGTLADVWLITYADGTQVIGKTVTGAPPDLFEAEADGLAALRGTGHLATPQVLAVTGRLLLLEAQSAQRPDHRHRPRRLADLGRSRPVHAVGLPASPSLRPVLRDLPGTQPLPARLGRPHAHPAPARTPKRHRRLRPGRRQHHQRGSGYPRPLLPGAAVADGSEVTGK
jgi:hypothetical protein